MHGALFYFAKVLFLLQALALFSQALYSHNLENAFLAMPTSQLYPISHFSNCLGMPNEEVLYETPESYILPLSYEDDPPLLVVPIPDVFKLRFNGSSYPDVLFVEFIPKNEDIACYSELITICQTLEVLDAHAFIKIFKSLIEETQTLDMHPEYTSYIRCTSEHGIKVGYYTSEHPFIHPHQLVVQAPRYRELLKVKTVQAEDRIWVIQYAIRYNPRTITEKQHQDNIDKMQDFFKTCKISFNTTAELL